ncbi:GNAT family N-acetyltransferase [Chelativorans xinjiangense]|uniref:GNAT family N-acetyltransferase n=1 Tax=Chelativorans xinjiangense TaxID=2681485 RepID=UPI00135C1A99|nr:GNAT family N-acetyltransferase [Chelativorans xinjiangense]
MLRMTLFPPDRDANHRWFVGHQDEWRAGEAYRFAVELNEEMISVVDIDGIVDHEGTLGYWFDRVAWGRGYSFEAAQAVTRFAFRDIALLKVKAGHAHDNPASGQILTKLGFRSLDTVLRFSHPRGEMITQHRYVLTPQE